MFPVEGRAQRRSFAWAVSLVLAVATGAALAQTVAVATVPIEKPSTSDRKTAEVVRAFYEAANAVIRTGDVAALDLSVAPDFADHTDHVGVTLDRSDLGRVLVAIHATTPTARLVVEDLVAVGDRGMARVTLREDEPGTFLGAPVRGVPVAWGTLDVLRVADRRVVERWGDGGNGVLLESLGTARLGTRLPIRAGIGLERVTLRPGDAIAGPTTESRLLWLETGILTVSAGPEPNGQALVTVSDGVATGETAIVAAGVGTTLTAGDLAALPGSTAYALRNDGPAVATAFVAVIHVPDAPDRSFPHTDPAYPVLGRPWPAEIAVQPLAGELTTRMPQGPATVGFGRMTLASGAAMPEITTPGPLLLTVETGAVDAVVTTGSAWIRDGTTGAARAARSASLGAGDGAFVPADSVIAFDNPDDLPAVVLLVAIVPIT